MATGLAYSLARQLVVVLVDTTVRECGARPLSRVLGDRKSCYCATADMTVTSERTDSAAHEVASNTVSVDPGAARSIVLVDDNEDLCLLLAELLRVWGHQVHVAHDGEAGVELVERVRPNVALINLGLPKLDGYAVARRLRLALQDQTTRLVAMTGFGRGRYELRAFEAGFEIHLVKPVSAHALKQAIA